MAEDQLYVHFIPGKIAQEEGKPWVIHSRHGCFKVGRVEFETVAGMITAEKAPEIGSKEAVCNCGVSNHHLAMLGVVNVIKKHIPTHGERSVGIIRRKDDETEETEVNVLLFRERIDGFEKELLDKGKEAKQAHGRADRLDSQLLKAQARLADASKDLIASTEKIKDLEGANVAVQQSLQHRSRDLSTLMETVKKLRSESSVGVRHHKAKDTPDLTEALSKSKRKCEQMKKQIKDVQATHKKRLSALEGSLRSVMLASVDRGQPPLAPGEKSAIELIALEALGLPDLLSAKERTFPSAEPTSAVTTPQNKEAAPIKIISLEPPLSSPPVLEIMQTNPDRQFSSNGGLIKSAAPKATESEQIFDNRQNQQQHVKTHRQTHLSPLLPEMSPRTLSESSRTFSETCTKVRHRQACHSVDSTLVSEGSREEGWGWEGSGGEEMLTLPPASIRLGNVETSQTCLSMPPNHVLFRTKQYRACAMDPPMVAFESASVAPPAIRHGPKKLVILSGTTAQELADLRLGKGAGMQGSKLSLRRDQAHHSRNACVREHIMSQLRRSSPLFDGELIVPPNYLHRSSWRPNNPFKQSFTEGYVPSRIRSLAL